MKKYRTIKIDEECFVVLRRLKLKHDITFTVMIDKLLEAYNKYVPKE